MYILGAEVFPFCRTFIFYIKMTWKRGKPHTQSCVSSVRSRETEWRRSCGPNQTLLNPLGHSDNGGKQEEIRHAPSKVKFPSFPIKRTDSVHSSSQWDVWQADRRPSNLTGGVHPKRGTSDSAEPSLVPRSAIITFFFDAVWIKH